MNIRSLPSALGAGMVVLLAAFRPDVGTAAHMPLTPLEETNQWPEVVINGRALSRPEILEIVRAYGQVLAGRFWYDPVSGLWGAEGRELSGYLRPGLPFGTLSPRASNGNTRIFVNGREINLAEALFYQWVLGAALPGRYWLDGRTGDFGLEGIPMPSGNLMAAIRSKQPGGQRGSGFWSGGVNGPGGMIGATDGSCSMVSTSAGTWSSGC
ncbi:MAG: hypothetical protein ABI634_18230 [Acidobacteriota bacterium]